MKVNGRGRSCLPKGQRAVLEALARGLLDKETAEILCLSPSAVRSHRRRLESRLGVKGAGPCVAVAWRQGLLDLERVADALLAGRAGSTATTGDVRQGPAQVIALSRHPISTGGSGAYHDGVTARTSDDLAARWLAMATGPDEAAATDAFGRLAESTRPGVLRMLRRSGLSDEVAEDVLQTALAEIWRSRRSVVARSGGEWYALIRRSASWQLSRRGSRELDARALAQSEDIPSADLPYLDAALAASIEAGRIRAAADELWLGSADPDGDTAVAAARLVLVDGLDAGAVAQMLGVERSRVEAWLRRQAVLRRALFRSLCWPTESLAGYVLRPHRPLDGPTMDRILSGAAEAELFGGWSPLEAKVAILRLRHGLTEKEIVRAMAGAADGPTVAAMVDRVVAALPFEGLARTAKARLDEADRTEHLAAADLWKRVSLEYAADDVPDSQILELAAPPAKVASFNLDAPKLNRWLVRGAILAQLAAYLAGGPA